MASPGNPRTPTEHLPPLLLGVITLIGGVATGLFADLPRAGQWLGIIAFGLWVFAIGRLLWNPQSASWIRWLIMAAFVATVALVLVAVWTGPRRVDRTLLLSAQGAQMLNDACPGAVTRQRAAARVALGQLQDPFVHVEPKTGACAGDDVRLRADDLVAVLPE